MIYIYYRPQDKVIWKTNGQTELTAEPIAEKTGENPGHTVVRETRGHVRETEKDEIDWGKIIIPEEPSPEEQLETLLEKERLSKYLEKLNTLLLGENIITVGENDIRRGVYMIKSPEKNEGEFQIIAIPNQERTIGSVFVGKNEKIPVSEAMRLNPSKLEAFLSSFPYGSRILIRDPQTGKTEEAALQSIKEENGSFLVQLLIHDGWQELTGLEFIKLEPALIGAARQEEEPKSRFTRD